MRSLYCNIRPDAPAAVRVVGVVVSRTYDPEAALRELASAPADCLFVLAQPKRGRPRAEDAVLEGLADRPVVVVPLNPWWKHSRGDDRRSMVDCELALYCSTVVVFDDGKDERMRFWRSQAAVNRKVRILT